MFGIKRFVLAIYFIATATGCISVKLPGQQDVVRSSAVKVSFNQTDYEKLNVKWADQAWKHKKTGAVISYLSSCDADPQLESLFQEAFSAFDQFEIKDQRELTFNKRRALEGSANGMIDGVPVTLEILVFKKDDCYYTLSHSVQPTDFVTSHEDFKSFKNNFQVP